MSHMGFDSYTSHSKLNVTAVIFYLSVFFVRCVISILCSHLKEKVLPSIASRYFSLVRKLRSVS